jgi:hypothetical protein
LKWIGKPAVVEHHTQVPFHLLKARHKPQSLITDCVRRHWRASRPKVKCLYLMVTNKEYEAIQAKIRK